MSLYIYREDFSEVLYVVKLHLSVRNVQTKSSPVLEDMLYDCEDTAYVSGGDTKGCKQTGGESGMNCVGHDMKQTRLRANVQKPVEC